jgi:hypothetical protein
MSACAVEETNAVKVSFSSDSRDFVEQFNNFALDLRTVSVVVGIVCRLSCKFLQSVEHCVSFFQRAFRCLNEGDTVIRVTDSLTEATELTSH